MKVKLSDVCVEDGVQTGPFGAQLHQSDYSEWGTPVCMPVNLVDGSISENGIARVSEEHVERLSRYKVKRGDLLYARRGDVGRGSLVGAHEDGWLCGTGCLKVTPDPSKIDSRYLFYLTSLPETIGWLVNHAKGTTMLNLNTAILSSLPLVIERNLEKQRRIAEVLSAYDELIENNRRQIKLLEEAAQRLYKEWFIDLKFPGHETTSIVNGLPEGWRTGCLGECCTLVKTISKQDERTGNELYIGLEHMPKGSICLRAHGVAADVIGNKTKFQKGDILFGKIRPYFHKVGFAQFDGITSTDAIVMRAVEGKQALLLAVTSSDEFVSYATATSKTGTKMPRADWDAMKSYQIPIPSVDVALRFETVYESFVSSIAQCSSLIVAAREARDRLLPKLMSGEIEV